MIQSEISNDTNKEVGFSDANYSLKRLHNEIEGGIENRANMNKEKSHMEKGGFFDDELSFVYVVLNNMKKRNDNEEGMFSILNEHKVLMQNEADKAIKKEAQEGGSIYKVWENLTDNGRITRGKNYDGTGYKIPLKNYIAAMEASTADPLAQEMVKVGRKAIESFKNSDQAYKNHIADNQGFKKTYSKQIESIKKEFGFKSNNGGSLNESQANTD